MTQLNHCPKCNARIRPDTRYCFRCHTSLEINQQHAQEILISEKSVLLTFFLCLFLGWFGIHRFYAGKYRTGLAMLITLGGLGTWVIIDLLLILAGHYQDSEGKYITYTPAHELKPLSSFFISFITLLGLIGVILIIISISIILNLIQQRYTIDHELLALQAADFETAYQYTSSDFQKNVSLSNFKSFTNQNPTLTNAKFQLDYEDYQHKPFSAFLFPQKALLKGTLLTPEGVSSLIYFYLIRENFSWRIYRIGTTLEDVLQSDTN